MLVQKAVLLNPVAVGPGSKPEPDKITTAIQEFEGMLLAQMLQSMRESALGGWQEEKDQSGATALEMAEGQLAKLMASNGGLGLARVLQKSLAPVEPKAPISDPINALGHKTTGKA